MDTLNNHVNKRRSTAEILPKLHNIIKPFTRNITSIKEKLERYQQNIIGNIEKRRRKNIQNEIYIY